MKLPKTYLVEVYLTEDIDNNSILRILTQSNPIKQTDPTWDNYYKKLADWACDKRRQSKITNISLDAIELSDTRLVSQNKLSNRYNTLGSLLNSLKSLMDGAGYNSKNEQSNLIQQTTLEILAELSKMPIPKRPEEPEKAPEEEGSEPPENEIEEIISNKSKLDWTAERARRLEDAKKTNTPTSDVLNKFYDDYYSQEYAGVESPEKDTRGIVTKLKSLDKILTIEFNKLGYNSEVNPFAQFLKILIQKKPKIFEKLNLNNYGAIHNSFIEKSVTGNMLGNYDEGNILFCEDLYNKNGLDIVEYLSLQKQALNKKESNKEYADIAESKVIAILFIAQKTLSDDYKENIELLKKDDDITLPITDGAKIKSLLEVQELYRHLFRAEAKKAVNAKVAEEILALAKQYDIVLSMIRYILDQNEFVNKYTEYAQEIEQWFKTAFTYNQNGEKINNSKKVLSGYIINATALNLILRHLVEYAENTRKEAENRE